MKENNDLHLPVEKLIATDEKPIYKKFSEFQLFKFTGNKRYIYAFDGCDDFSIEVRFDNNYEYYLNENKSCTIITKQEFDEVANKVWTKLTEIL